MPEDFTKEHILKTLQFMAKQEKKLFYRMICSLIFVLSGYGVLIFCDWKIALAVFLIHFSMNIENGMRFRK